MSGWSYGPGEAHAVQMRDAERSEVARRLRGLQSRQSRDEDRPEITTWEGIGAAVLPDDEWQRIDRFRSRDNRTQAVRSIIAGRLADLIEPEPERTCHDETESPMSFLCGECGWFWNDPEDELGFRYCPSCGARVIG